MVRLIASDMDGTLLNHEGRVSVNNGLAIKKVQRMGIRFLICTGRSYEDALIPLREQGITCDVICMNGSAVYDREGKLLSKHGLSQVQVSRIVECSREDGVVFDFMTQKGSYTTVSREALDQCLDKKVFLPSASMEVAREIGRRFHFVETEKLFSSDLEFFKISIIHEDADVLSRIREKLSGLVGISIASSFATNLEITSEDASKGIALLSYAKARGIKDREIMALGDSENDYSMLSLPLGYTIAMENAAPLIKKTARCQTRSNEADGVAFAIENIVGIEKARA